MPGGYSGEGGELGVEEGLLPLLPGSQGIIYPWDVLPRICAGLP